MEDNTARQKILNAARDLFLKYGIRSISMDDIAHHLGISKKTIYQHFADKDDIVTTSMANFIGMRKERFKTIRGEAKDAVEILLRLHYDIRSMIGQTTPSLLFELRKYHGRAAALMQEFKYTYLGAFIRENLKAGIEQGLFREDIDVDITTAIRLEELSMPHNEQIFPPEQYNLADVSAAILEHFILAIATPRGRTLFKKYQNALSKGKYQPHEV